ncbi:MAG: histidine phosphatase family protein [Flammeovirgaceae bacterium]|nr:histidine phosphatase family protein [Flammeovirgaceae bacterium]
MYTLLLVRHAQSAEKQHGQADRERELTQFGITQSMQLGNYLAHQNFNLDLILTSPAARALTTAQLISDVLKNNSIVLEEPELYDASPRTFLQAISAIDGNQRNVLAVGHNPTISHVAEYLTKAEIGDILPCGLVIVKFTISDWNEIQSAQGELIDIINPV